MTGRSFIPSLFDVPTHPVDEPPNMLSMPPVWTRPPFNPTLPPPGMSEGYVYHQSHQTMIQPSIHGNSASHCQSTKVSDSQKFRSESDDIKTKSSTEVAMATLTSWLNKNKLDGNIPHALTTGVSGAVSSTSLLDVKILVHRLHVLRLKLRDMSGSTGKEHEADKVTQEIGGLISKLDSAETKQRSKLTLRRAQKRKARSERQKRTLCEEGLIYKEKVNASNQQIENWLQQIQEKKRVDQMRKSADESMSGVRQKITDTTRQKELILSLTKLRSVREHNYIQTHRTNNHLSSNEKFQLKTEELLLMLDQRLDLYRKEETALKVMLETQHEASRAEEERIEKQRKLKHLQKQEKKTHLWLFGSQAVPEEIDPFYHYYMQSEEDADAFVQVRREWDCFITHAADPRGSRIPKGWVIPPPPETTSHEWKIYSAENINTNTKIITGT